MLQAKLGSAYDLRAQALGLFLDDTLCDLYSPLPHRKISGFKHEANVVSEKAHILKQPVPVLRTSQIAVGRVARPVRTVKDIDTKSSTATPSSSSVVLQEVPVASTIQQQQMLRQTQNQKTVLAGAQEPAGRMEIRQLVCGAAQRVRV